MNGKARQFRLQKRGYGLLVMIASALLVLAWGGVGWASVCSPGVTGLVEIDQPANEGFDNIAGAFFDWANSGANANPRACSPTTGTFCPSTSLNCSTNTCPQTCVSGTQISCSCPSSSCPAGKGGLFDGGVFISATQPPLPPPETATALADSTIAAASFGVDPLSVDQNVMVIPYNNPTAAAVNCGSGDPTVYTGVGGETNGDTISIETFGTGSVPNKDDISNVFAISHQVIANATAPSCPTTCSAPCSTTCASNSMCTDTNEIFAGFERVINNGDSHVDLEFLQAQVSLVPGAKPAQYPCAGKFQGDRTPGDFLLAVDFTTGGTLGTQTLYHWVCGNASVDANGRCNPTKAKGGPHYEVTSCPGNECFASVNGAGAVGCGGWDCRNADGTQTNSVNTNELYEVGIDLAAIGFRGCISSFLPHTRSSQSFTAVLKDFKLLQFNTCRPSTRLTKTASSTSVVTGGSVTYTYTEENTGNVDLTSPSVVDDKCSPVSPSLKADGIHNIGDTNNDGILNPGEIWTFTCTLNNITQDTTNTAIGHANFTVNGVTKDVTFCADPSNPPANTICSNSSACTSTTDFTMCPDCDPAGDRKTCERDQTTVTVVTPNTCLKKSATVTNIQTTVLYTYDEKNESVSPGVPLNSPTVVDTECTSPPPTGGGGTVTLQTCGTTGCSSSGPSPCCSGDSTKSCTANKDCSGDANGNGILDPGETFHFQCTATFSGAHGFTDIAYGHGCFTAGGVTRDVTNSGQASTCGSGTSVFPDPQGDETDTKTVTVSSTVTGGHAACP